MTENRASSGVRNLRAMFESQSAASSPEPRGRSPSRRINAETNRPTSKVKASFVSVEPGASIPQALGTTKGTVDGLNSPEAQRRESFSISKDLGEEAVEELKKVVSQEKEARESNTAIEEAVPEEAIESRDASLTPPSIKAPEETMPNLGSIMKGSDFPETESPGQQKSEEKVQEKVQKKVPEQAKQNAPAQTESSPSTKTENIEDKLAALSLSDLPPENPDKAVTGAQEEVSLKPADPKDETAISGGAALQPPTDASPSTNSTVAAAKAPEPASQSPEKARSTGTPAVAASTRKPAPISVAKASAAKATASKSPLAKSPGVAKLPKTPTTPRPTSSKPVTKTATPAKDQPKPTVQKSSNKAPVSKTSQSSLKSTASTTASAAAKAKAPVAEAKKTTPKPPSAPPAAKASSSTSPGGFKKPRPKSPTKSARLPAHLTAPTAAFAAKHDPRLPDLKAGTRPTPGSHPTTTKTAPPPKKAPARASLAPATGKRPESRASTVGAADDSFLARMMRPTAASASKVHEKAASPPRRNASFKAPLKSKIGQPSLAAKAKSKAGELASKTKEAVTNGKDEESKEGKVDETPANEDIKEHSEEKTQSAETVPEVPSAAQGEIPAPDNQETLPVN